MIKLIFLFPLITTIILYLLYSIIFRKIILDGNKLILSSFVGSVLFSVIAIFLIFIWTDINDASQGPLALIVILPIAFSFGELCGFLFQIYIFKDRF